MFSKKRVWANFCILLVLLLVLTSCIRNKSWTYYSPRHKVARTPLIEKTIVVLPFSDHREHEIVHENPLKCFLPFVTSCTVQAHSRPESLSRHAYSGAWEFSPMEDIAKGMAVEIRGHNLFKKVYYSTTNIPANLELHGILRSTVYEQDWMFYGLSLGAAFAWLVGAPIFTVGNHIAFEISIHDQGSGRVIWTNVYEGQFVNYSSPLWRWRPLDFAYDKLLGEMMPAILADLEHAISVTRF